MVYNRSVSVTSRHASSTHDYNGGRCRRSQCGSSTCRSRRCRHSPPCRRRSSEPPLHTRPRLAMETHLVTAVHVSQYKHTTSQLATSVNRNTLRHSCPYQSIETHLVTAVHVSQYKHSTSQLSMSVNRNTLRHSCPCQSIETHYVTAVHISQ